MTGKSANLSTHMKRVFAIIILLFPFAGTATTPAEIRAAVKNEIAQSVLARPGNPGLPGKVHLSPPYAPLHQPRPATWWRGLGPEASSVVIQMYRDSHGPFERIKLLEALRNFDDRTTAAFLESEATTQPNSVLRNVALKALGQSQGSREKSFISGFLSHTDPHTRVAAAETLLATGDPAARPVVQHYLAGETVPWVIARLKGK